MEQLDLFNNKNDQLQTNMSYQEKYSILQWILIIFVLVLYNFIGIFCFFILPINFYLFIFKNEQQLKNHYKKLKISIFNLLIILFGKNWLIYIPAAIYWSLFFLVNILLKSIPALIYLIIMQSIRLLWKCKTFILFCFLIFLIINDIEYTKFIGFITLSNLWFSWMFWLDFFYYIIDFNHTGNYWDVWHSSRSWNSKMRGRLVWDYKTIIIDKWMALLTIDEEKEKIHSLQKWHHRKMAWDYIRTTLGWTTGFYYRRSYWSLDWKVWYYKLKSLFVLTFGGSSHWWWYTYQKLNVFYRFCLILTFLKKFILIPINVIGVSFAKFIKNFSFIGYLFGLIKDIVLYGFKFIIINLKKLIIIILTSLFKFDYLKKIFYYFLILIKFYYKISCLNLINKYYSINIIIYYYYIYWSWYINIIFMDFFHDIKSLYTFNPYFLNIGIIDILMNIFNLFKNQLQDVISLKSMLICYFISPFYAAQLYIDNFSVNLEFSLTWNDFINEYENSLEVSKLNTLFLNTQVKGRKMYLNLYWLNDFEDYFDILESTHLANQFYARKEYNWNANCFVPSHFSWYDNPDRFSIITEKFYDKRKFFWFWFENRFWWLFKYGKATIKEDSWLEAIRKYGNIVFQIIFFNLWKWYYYVLIIVFVLNQGLRDYLNNTWNDSTYLTNREMAWRIFRSQKPKNLNFLFISINQMEVLKEITNMTANNKVINKLFKKLLIINLKNEFNSHFVKTINKKLHKNSNFYNRRDIDIISKGHFNFYLESKFECLRNSIGLYHDFILPFIAYYYSKNHLIKKAWSEYDNVDYSYVYHLTYDTKILSEYTNYWKNNILYLETINQRWFNGHLNNWLLPREFESFEIITSTSKEGDTSHEYEDNELTYIPHAYYWWFIIFPLMIFYHAFTVQTETAWIWNTFTSSYSLDFIPFLTLILSHCSWFNELLWILPETLVSEKIPAGPSSPILNNFLADYYPVTYDDYFLLKKMYYWENGKFDSLSNYFYNTEQNMFDSIDELKLFELMRIFLLVILLLITSLFKINKKNLNQKPLNISIWYEIKNGLKKIWFWK